MGDEFDGEDYDDDYGDDGGDDYTEVSDQSWFSRMGQSIKSVGLGLLIFIAAFPLIWKNEGCAVRIAKGLQEGAKNVIILQEPKVKSSNNSKLVHFSGDAATNETLKDNELGINENAIKISRSVEMYQWREVVKTKTKKKLGGGKKTIKKYKYKKGWSSTIINSDNFKRRRSKYTNPQVMAISSKSIVANNVNVGEFKLPKSLIGSITSGDTVTFTRKNIDALPDRLSSKARIQDGKLYIGDPSNPKVGDLRISATIVKPQKVSIIAKQQGNSLTSYKTGQGTTIMMLKTGIVSAKDMFTAAEEGNVMRTWLLRLLGFILMFAGLSMIFKPVVTLGDVVPIVGSILNFGVGVMAGVVSFALTFIVIALAWVFYRPIIGIPMLVIGIGAFVAFKIMGKNKKANA
ncbi:TMEM43 family protein [Spirochaetota bacterium]